MVAFIGIIGGLFALLVVAYLIISKKANNKNTKYVRQLVEGTKKSSFSMEIFYQKFYVKCVNLGFLRR